ncbi:MAG: DNA polymerase beta superfamily protein [Flammeovirgaceae bacterium]
MTLQDLYDQKLILLECISGSKAYGLDLPTSDTDIKGVFILPKAQFFGMDYMAQISNATNDIVFYELGRFMELLYKNNPNILELLNTPATHVLKKHPLMNKIKSELVLSKLCKQTFAGYAQTQIKKARGLNKKILNPLDKARKSVLHFCQVTVGKQSKNLVEWLAEEGKNQAQCGLVNLDKMKNLYALFYDATGEKGYQGIIQKETANEVCLSSIPKSEEAIAYVYFNRDGYSKYCKDYKEYWAWVEQRNEVRYENTITHGKNYDAKNMMHTFRLLEMAEEILSEGKVTVKRPNREEMLAIRRGAFTYDELIAKAEIQLEKVEAAYRASKLPEQPEKAVLEQVLIEIRKEWYG